MTAYYGERDRVGDRFLADALMDVCERHALQASVLLRGAEGFGLRHHLRSDRLLTLSEDLPAVTVAMDTRKRIEAALPEISALITHGLLTLEGAQWSAGRFEAVNPPHVPGNQVKLTLLLGRHERHEGRPAYRAAVDVLHRHGFAGATVLLGVDGTAHGVRQRARLFGRNADVPLMVVSIGDGDRAAAALPELRAIHAPLLVTLESAGICKCDGQTLAQPPPLPRNDESRNGLWQKLTVYAGEQSRAPDGHQLHATLIRRLRQAGARGGTTLRGIWGYAGHHPPHGDRFFALRRHVPMVSVIIDKSQRIQDAFALVDELTAATGLVTIETVPAFSSRATGVEHGELPLADPQPSTALR